MVRHIYEAATVRPKLDSEVLFFGGYGDPLPDYYLGGFQVALNAIEALRRQLASEFGGHGIRAVTLQTGGGATDDPQELRWA